MAVDGKGVECDVDIIVQTEIVCRGTLGMQIDSCGVKAGGGEVV